jgi:predicted Zn-dependent peptidase
MGVIASCALAHPQGAVFANDDVAALFDQIDLEYEIFTLPNGLTTLVYPDHKAPEVFVGIYYRVGSKDEPAGKSGFAHLYEHLMFQGTANAPGEFFTYLNNIGATGMNGSTNTDRTNYFETVPTGSLDAVISRVAST